MAIDPQCPGFFGSVYAREHRSRFADDFGKIFEVKHGRNG